MIGLIAAGRGGGGDETPTFYTVPWSPMIAKRPGSQIPGFAYGFMMSFVRVMSEAGHADRMGELTDYDFVHAALQTGVIVGAMVTRMAAKLAAELEIVPQRRRG